MDTSHIEIMAPAGSYESLRSAINAGAKSVYFGIGRLNMRSKSSSNFSNDDLRKIVKICDESNVASYLTMNTLVYDHDLELMRKTCDAAKSAGVTAVIASDIAVLEYAKSIGLEIHISTQCNISNIEAVRFYAQYADVVVLARELTLPQITKICDDIKGQDIRGPNGDLVRIEIFVHGALCIAISGKCHMSLSQYNSSANRGACLQSCRRSYKIIDEETGDELVVDNKYIMSPKDLSTIMYIDQIIASGASVLKIEGRGRSPDYVDLVVRAYRRALDLISQDKFTKDEKDKLDKDLKTVFNRGFWQGGYYLGKKNEMWAGLYGSKATKQKFYVGEIDHFYNKLSVAQITPHAYELNIGDEIVITGATTGTVRTKLEEIHTDDGKIETCKKKQECTFKVPSKVRKNDKVYVIKDRVDLQENSAIARRVARENGTLKK